MKQIKKLIPYPCILFVWGILTLLGIFSSCKKEKTPFEWVDLRYKAEDFYKIACTSPEIIKIQVKSTDPWEVYSIHQEENWCTITPSTGNDPDRTYDVEIQYTDNVNLDDRIDTVIIKSSYWTGKWITIKQKGTAFLKLGTYDEFLLAREGETRSFDVESNQDWSVEVTEGKEWLSAQKISEGGGNGKFNIIASENNGVMRTAIVTLLDRQQKPQATLKCVQDGVQLDISTSLIKKDYKAENITFNVLSNSQWTLQIDSKQTGWLTINGEDILQNNNLTFENNQEITLGFTENDTRALREATITFKTKNSSIEVLKKVVVKQGYKPYPIHWEFTETNFPASNDAAKGWVYQGGAQLSGDDLKVTYIGETSRIYKFGNAVGKYKLKLNPMEPGSKTGLWFKAGNIEFRFHLDASTRKTDVSNNQKIPGMTNISFDPNQSHELEFEYTQGSGGKSNVLYYLDGVKFVELKNINVTYESPITLYIGAQKGTVIYDWMEFTAPVNMDNF